MPAISHHLYDNLSKTWRKVKPQCQPYLYLQARTLKMDLTTTASNLSQGTDTSVKALADTGAQCCLAGTNLLTSLKISSRDLIPVSTGMSAANNGQIKLLGATLLNLSGKNRHGQRISTNQMVYITDCSGRFFLNRDACTELGLISKDFPTIGDTSKNSANVHASTLSAPTTSKSHPATAPCGCPTRMKPTKPIEVPCPITDNNRKKLQEFLLKHYSASTFNTCTHQPLPHMSGPPMKLMIDPKATPVAHHKAIPVPLHFQAAVKTDLDRDVRLGVIERVPYGTPARWCHRMVICAKKDGTPRRTIDFQALNRHASRETHHNPSPFHLARSVPHNMKKNICDAWNGYHGVKLVEEDWDITTFITPWGRYRYRTAPQGYIA